MISWFVIKIGRGQKWTLLRPTDLDSGFRAGKNFTIMPAWFFSRIAFFG